MNEFLATFSHKIYKCHENRTYYVLQKCHHHANERVLRRNPSCVELENKNLASNYPRFTRPNKTSIYGRNFIHSPAQLVHYSSTSRRSFAEKPTNEFYEVIKFNLSLLVTQSEDSCLLLPYPLAILRESQPKPRIARTVLLFPPVPLLLGHKWWQMSHRQWRDLSTIITWPRDWIHPCWMVDECSFLPSRALSSF